MAKFRKRAVEVVARQWWPPGDPRHDPAMVSHRKGNAVSPPDYRRVGDIFPLSTIPGMGDDVFFLRLNADADNVRIHPGDWIVEAGGKKWAVESDVFDAIYEPVEQPNG